MWQGIYENRSVTAGEQAQVSREIARAMGCVNYTSRDEDILQCMKNKPFEEIAKIFSVRPFLSHFSSQVEYNEYNIYYMM